MRKIFPASLLLENRLCVLVGAGTVAAHKAERLLAAGARLRVVAPSAVPALRALADDGKIELREREFENSDLDGGAFLAVAATGDAVANARIAAAARERKILCSAVDAGWRAGDFIWPAVVARDGVTVALASGGNHRKTSVAADIFRSRADEFFAELHSREAEISSENFPENSGENFGENSEKTEGAGTARERKIFPVIIAGAGVGAGNVTLNVVRALQNCDVCLHDALIPADVLAFVPAAARKIAVGKRCGKHSAAQNEISALAVAFARRGARVVRLKGGDPTIFARLREELEALRAAGIPWKILPGISAFQAAAAAESIPLTTRDSARSVTLATGREASKSEAGTLAENSAETPENFLRFFAADGRTVAGTIVYMGVREFPKIAARLLAAGAAGTTPVRAIFGVGDARGFSVAGTLAALELPETDLPGILFLGLESVPAAANFAEIPFAVSAAESNFS